MPLAEGHNSVYEPQNKKESAYCPSLWLCLAKNTKQSLRRSRYCSLPVIGIHPRVDSKVPQNPRTPEALLWLQTMPVL